MNPAITISNLTFQFPKRPQPALNDVSFTIAQGECVAVLGPNGAGKSTLLLHLNGLLPEKAPSTPSIWIDGTPVVRSELHTVRRKVGMLFQDPDDQLISATVFEDVAFGPRQLGIEGSELEALVAASLQSVGLAGFEQREAHRLSQGEKRRVCLAGVLACQPAVLVLDEPTSDLDPRARREFKNLLRTLPGAKLIATHDLELAVDLCTRVLVLDQGRLVAEGNAVSILSDEPLMLAHGLEKPHALMHYHPHARG